MEHGTLAFRALGSKHRFHCSFVPVICSFDSRMTTQAERRFNALVSQLAPRLGAVASAIASVDLRDYEEDRKAGCTGHCDKPAAADETETATEELPIYAQALPIEGTGISFSVSAFLWY